MNLPGPTKATVKPSDLIGRWSYKSIYSKTDITIEFRPAGSFSQTIKQADGTPRSQTGKWTLDGPSIDLENVLMHFGNDWNPDSATWWFTGDAGKLELYGGDTSDPDSCWPLKFLGPPTTATSAPKT